MCFMARLHPIAAAVGLHHCPLIFTRKQDPLMLQQRAGLAKSDGGFHLKKSSNCWFSVHDFTRHGKLTKIYGNSPCLMGKSTISTGSFSIAMLNYQRVLILFCAWFYWFSSWALARLTGILLWMEEILHHLGWLKPYKRWDKPPINWGRISSIHSMLYKCYHRWA